MKYSIEFTPESMADLDAWLATLVEERLKHSSGKIYSQEEILMRHGITLEDIDAMEDVEIE